MKKFTFKTSVVLLLVWCFFACENEKLDYFDNEYMVNKSLAISLAIENLFDASIPKNSIEVQVETVMDSNMVPYYYIVNTTYNLEHKFIIVSGDKRMEAILGYGKEFFNLDDAPDQLLFWLSQFNDKIDHLRFNNVPDNQMVENFEKRAILKINQSNSSIKEDSSTDFLIKTNWNQGCVYNGESPLFDSEYLECENILPCNRAYTGCVSTCISQIVNFYQSMSPVDYTLLKPQYSDLDMNTLQGDEVAKLMRMVGDIMNTTYNCNGSGSPASYILPEPETAKALGFTQTIIKKYYTRNINYYVVSEIKSGYPVVFSGIDHNSEAGHLWIADGVSEQDFDYYVHFNWGWGGNRDGWFVLGDFDAGNYNFGRSTNLFYNFRK